MSHPTRSSSMFAAIPQKKASIARTAHHPIKPATNAKTEAIPTTTNSSYSSSSASTIPNKHVPTTTTSSSTTSKTSSPHIPTRSSATQLTMQLAFKRQQEAQSSPPAQSPELSTAVSSTHKQTTPTNSNDKLMEIDQTTVVSLVNHRIEESNEIETISYESQQTTVEVDSQTTNTLSQDTAMTDVTDIIIEKESITIESMDRAISDRCVTPVGSPTRSGPNLTSPAPIYTTPPKTRPSSSARARHVRSLTQSSTLPPPSPLRSPIRLFSHQRGGSLSGGSGVLFDARYLARLASGSGDQSSTTNSPRKTPAQSPFPASPQIRGASHMTDMTLSPYPENHTHLQPRRLQLDTGSTPSSPSPVASPYSSLKRKSSSSPAHPLLHVYPSPRRLSRTNSGTGEMAELAPFPFTGVGGSPHSSISLQHSPSSSTTSGVASNIGGQTDTSLRALQQEASMFDFSDRFIPSRAGSNLEHGYFQDEESALMQENINQGQNSATVSTGGTQAFSPAYGLLLRSEILGSKDGVSSSSNTAGNTREPINSALIIHRPGGNPIVSPTASDATTPSNPASTPDTPSDSSANRFSSPHHQPLSPSFPQTFRFKSPRINTQPCDPFTTSTVGVGTQRLLAQIQPQQRVISKMPFKVLDAPGLKDDFYLNLVDWSAQNVVAVALGNQVYLWSGATTKVAKLFELEQADDLVTSVGWTLRGNHLAVGTKSGHIQIWDVAKQKCVQTLHGHTYRVGSLAWNSHLLASGSRDRNILLHDPRAGPTKTATLTGHVQEVCGLKWSYDEHQLASGGNDNKLLIWSSNQLKPMFKFDQHTAAVKAVAWSPHQHGLLCSGGGTSDRCIRFWSTTTGTAVSHIDTGSQVCNLLWSKNVNEIVSTHGYSLNQIITWRYPTMQQVTTLTGHSMRVLYLAVSPDGQTILTGAGDETLRFWNVFPSAESRGSVGMGSNSLVLPSAAEQILR